ncbi:MAG TPA: HAD-IB family phosphatase [Planctomycetota bacterium]|nr:HAD-IB family phosphatase [Planctomycetota bacterium]
MLILCDFDGTITLQDVTNLIWDRFIGPSWRGDLLSSYKRGHISHLKIMVDGYKLVREPKYVLMDYVRPLVSLRAGFDALRAHCAARQWPLAVVSGGLDFYIQEFLPAGVPFYSYTAAFNEHWHVAPPPHIEKAEAEDFKVSVKRLLKKQHRKEHVAFIGDGRNDFPVASKADKVFAVRHSMLAQLCQERGVACREFDDFAEIGKMLGE